MILKYFALNGNPSYGGTEDLLTCHGTLPELDDLTLVDISLAELLRRRYSISQESLKALKAWLVDKEGQSTQIRLINQVAYSGSVEAFARALSSLAYCEELCVLVYSERLAHMIEDWGVLLRGDPTHQPTISCADGLLKGRYEVDNALTEYWSRRIERNLAHGPALEVLR